MSKRAASAEPFKKSTKAKILPNDSKQAQRRNKLFNSRQIRTSNNDPSFKEGILDVPSFLKSREFEIQQLEQAQLRSRYSASTRCFQSLPRTLRRRTASHNVKRVPKRMRKRATREMKVNHDANNKTGTEAKKKTHLKGKELYKLKLSKKLLRVAARLKLNKFGTDETHSLADYNLRNRMKLITLKIKEIESGKLDKKLKTSSEQEAKILKSKIYLNNIMGSYDNTGLNLLLPKPRGNLKYRKRQKKFVWLPTHIWHTKRAHLTKRWGYQIPLRPTQKCFRSTHRKSISDGGLICDTSYMDTMILESLVKEDLMSLLKKITNMIFKIKKNKFWDGFIYIEDESKTNKLCGKATIFVSETSGLFKAMIRLHPSIYEEFFQYLKAEKSENITLNDCRYAIGSIDLMGPMSLSAITQVLNPTVTDLQNKEVGTKILQLSSLQDLNSFSIGSVMSVFTDDPRLVSKPIKVNPNKFKIDPIDLIIEISKGSAINHESVDSLLSFDGRLKSYENQPTIKQLSARRSKLLPGTNKLNKATTDPTIPVMIVKQDKLRYTMILPWYWVLPFWIQLNKILHLSIVGLKQCQQLNFENGNLTYPNDYPFLMNGFIENFVNGNELFKKWSSIQPGKKLNYEKLDLMNNDEVFGKGEIGFPFNCDWDFLRLLRHGVNKIEQSPTATKFEVSNWNSKLERDLKTLNDVYEFIKDTQFLQKEKLSHGELLLSNPVQLYNSTDNDSSKLPIAPINISILNKGHPKDNARIYSIPKQELSQWLKIHESKKANNKTDYRGNSLQCPHANYLIGFVTSGTFNLSKGHGTGIGYIDLAFIMDKYILIRNVGESKPRLAEFKLIQDV